MVKDMIFGVVGGLGLFLYGMGLLSDGLKKVAGKKLKKLLEILTKRCIFGVLVGALITCLIQSSSATTVMIVGFVNAGLLTLQQALSVVLGANIGTTITAWIVSAFGLGGLKITMYSMPLIGLGFLLQIIGKTERNRSIGSIMLGFGLLFIGIGFMEDAFGPLRTNEQVQRILIALGDNPILAVLAGTAITILIQSSSASIMIVQVLAFQGAFGTDWDIALRVAIPFILGDNIGTTITAQLAALRANRNSKRVAMGHTVFNILGVLYILPLVWKGWFADWVEWVSPFTLSQETIMLHIAISHSLFNIVNTIIFMPGLKWLEKIVLWVIPVNAQEALKKPVVLEHHLLDTPVIALEQAKREIARMAVTAAQSVNDAIEGLANDDMVKLNRVQEAEDMTDDFQKEITDYLVELSRRQLSDEVATELPVFLHSVNDLERIGDHAVNIAEIARRKIEHKIIFTDSAQQEIGQLQAEISQMFNKVLTSLENNDADMAKSALENENRLNHMQVDFRRNHVQRMGEGLCTAESGLIFIDLVDNAEKIGDHLTNIAQSVMGGLQWDSTEEIKYTKPVA
ncbi:MAG: Na/Pi cotransporter family protein [Phycisphaerae bacterium]|nr:Na/Pi cotransporter family protein [Phycisphaerae bacterium]